MGNGAQQQMQSFVGIERTKKGENGFPAKTERGLEGTVRQSRPFEGVAIDCIGDNGDLVVSYTASHDVSPQPLANRCHRVRPMERARFDKPCSLVMETSSPMGAVTRCRILPKGAHFVDDRNCVSPAGADRCERVEDRRMSVKNGGARFIHDIVEGPTEIVENFF